MPTTKTGGAESARAWRATRQRPVSHLLLATGLVVALFHLIADRLTDDVLHITSTGAQALEVVTMGLVTSLVLWVGVLRPLQRQVATERRAAEEHQAQIQLTAQRQQFESQLHRALDMADTEQAAYRVTTKALTMVLDDRDAELLLADSSDAHLQRALTLVDEGPASCGVGTPHECPAVRRAQTMRFSSSDNLDACPHLDGRPGGPVAAACVPLSVGGRSIGVLHTATDPDHPLTSSEVMDVEAVADQAGARIGMLRVMSATTLQAATDPLTGLLNRRALEDKVHELRRRGVPYALAMADLDHFKQINDTHGHDAGDRALRLFAQTMLRTLRSEDLVCRFGGEEFVLVFPERSIAEAVLALERVRQELILALTAGTTPGFTASFGVAASSEVTSSQELVRLADAALLRAKREGRDRIVASSSSEPVPLDAGPAWRPAA